jgi:hypothetical protein
MTIRKLTLTILATLCAITGVLTLGSTHAFAILSHKYLSQLTGFHFPGSVAVDSNSDVYVAENNAENIPGTVDRFSASDQPMPFTASEPYVQGSKLTGTPTGPGGSVVPFGELQHLYKFGNQALAIDNATGDLYVATQVYTGTGAVVDAFSSTGEYLFQLTGTPVSAPVAGPFVCEELNILFDQSTQDLHVLCGHTMNVFSASGGYMSQSEPGGGSIFAFDDQTNGMYIAGGNLGAPEVNILGEPGGWTGAATPFGSFETAISALGFDQKTEHIYVASYLRTQGGSSIDGPVDEFSGSLPEKYLGQITGTPSGPFGYQNDHQVGSNSVLVSVAVAPTNGDVYVVERITQNNKVNGVVDVFGPDIVSAADVLSQIPSQVKLHNAKLNGQLNVGKGVATSYYFEYGTTSAYGFATTPASGEGNIHASVQLEGLQSDTEYHFRVVATNANGTSYGRDATFATLSGFTGLPDGRGYEMVSPVSNADGDVYFPGTGEFSGINEGQDVEETGLPTRASADGNAVQYASSPLATGGNGQIGVGLGNEFVATRNPGGGWTPVDLTTNGLDNLSHEAVSYEAMFANEFSNSGTSTVSADSHNLTKNKRSLFDSVGGRLVPVSVLPDGTMVSEAAYGAPPGEEDHVISADGSRIFWTDVEEGPDKNHIFVRENGNQTAPVSAGGASYWTASTDGRYAFYTENETLWRFDVESETREEIAGEGAGVLGVVGVNETGEDGAYVYFVAQGVLAPGATPGNCAANINGKSFSGNCNLYMRYHDVTSFVARLSGQDDDIEYSGFETNKSGVTYGDWSFGLGERTAQVTPNGHSVVFMSYANLTSYDKKGVAEVYVYDADTGRVSCASCQPTDAPPSGNAVLPWSGIEPGFSFQHRWISEDGSRVFFASTEALVGSDTNGVQDVYEWEREGSGSCGLKSPARQDGGCVYLLSGGTSSDESYFLDSSASGNDVFMITRAELVSQDQGETFEVYDARVGADEPPSEPVCTGTGCQGLPAGPPLFATPSSVTFNGVGNFPPSSSSSVPRSRSKKVRCVKGRVLSHGKCVKPRGKGKGKKARKSGRDRGAK